MENLVYGIEIKVRVVIKIGSMVSSGKIFLLMRLVVDILYKDY